MSIRPSDDRLLKASDVAELLQISSRTLWRWKSRHRLPKPRYAGKVVRWWRSDIIRWLDGGCPPQDPDQE